MTHVANEGFRPAATRVSPQVRGPRKRSFARGTYIAASVLVQVLAQVRIRFTLFSAVTTCMYTHDGAFLRSPGSTSILFEPPLLFFYKPCCMWGGRFRLVKVKLFTAYFSNVYMCALWVNYRKTTFHQFRIRRKYVSAVATGMYTHIVVVVYSTVARCMPGGRLLLVDWHGDSWRHCRMSPDRTSTKWHSMGDHETRRTCFSFALHNFPHKSTCCRHCVVE